MAAGVASAARETAIVLRSANKKAAIERNPPRHECLGKRKTTIFLKRNAGRVGRFFSVKLRIFRHRSAGA
jgi:hypothetical protein